ncbi:uncharacterized protein At1g04910-like [Carica papaya]|uniref:uncharacterized protein At1g04910-like n=1 Tax=Carica papaya TaxID=3649 RepID=UPI000B8C6F35|nr:uncharacterized protein At1g04910-like [Carica papaya]
MEKELKVKPAGVRSPLACMELAIMATFSILLVLCSFEDIFDLNYFILSLRDEVRILKELPQKEKRLVESESVYCMYPISFASMKYYYDKVLPRIKAHQVVRFTLADARLANNGLPDEVQKLRCRAYYNAMRFTQEIEEMGQKIVSILRQIGPFLVLHLRYEKDMIAFTGCTEGFTKEESKELTKMRYSFAGWKHYPIDSKRRRQFGSCPLTPEETALSLQALGIDSNMTIYIAAGNIYATEKRMAVLKSAYPKMLRKETLLEPSDLKPFQNYSNQMAALDYIVALKSDIFVPTFGGNMARAVEGHRRYLGFRKTILLDRMIAVNLIDLHRNRTLSWKDLSEKMKAAHAEKMGQPTRRIEKPNQPRYEDYFYSNPHECLTQLAEPPST